MTRAVLWRIARDLLAPYPAEPPAGFAAAAGRLLHARHLAAYGVALPHVEGRDVIEIGTHRGYGSRIVAPRARSFVGIDLAFDHALAAKREGGVASIQADGQRLPLRDACADVVITFQVIEHVWSVTDFLQEIVRVLRPGGVAVISTPQSRGRLLLNQIPWNDEHLREYDEGGWSRLLAPSFDLVETLGLFGDDGAEAIERRRVFMDAWEHYFAGSWGRPFRLIGKVERRLSRSRGTIPPGACDAILAGSDDASLAKRFVTRPDRLGDALDLFAICRKGGPGAKAMPGSAGDSAAFDGPAYWRERLGAEPNLLGTGTAGAPLEWQLWLYRGKLRAYRRLLGRAGFTPSARSILDFGCGTGYFEDAWERLGTRRADGIDVVPAIIERLGDAHPKRRYLCADLTASGPEARQRIEIALAEMGHPDLITAIDVLYHIVDDDALITALRRLTALLPAGGLFLFTDALIEQETGLHVRFRSLNQWRQILPVLGLAFLDREPVFALNNRLSAAAVDLPGPVGAAQHLLDLPILRTMPVLANNWAVLARKEG